MHPYEIIHGKPYFVVKWWFYNNIVKEELNPDYFSEEEKEVYNNYYSMMMMKQHSVVDIVTLMPWRWIVIGIHDMTGPDRLGNPSLDFPICAAFGDRDFIGTGGTDKIVRNNMHFKSGRSQIIIVDKCSHLM